MRLDPYTDLLRRRGSSEPSFSYLLDTFLQSRIATDHESNKEYFDEDVNIYLSLLLNSMVSDQFHRLAAHYVAGYESDLPEILDRADTSYMKYQIYRMNADFLLLHTGLFNIPDRRNPEGREVLASAERGKTYYRLACSFTDRIPERYRPLSQVLAKLSYGFDTYREILSFMRGEYLNLVERISDHDLGLLYEDMNEIDKNESLRAVRDSLLDAYLACQRDNSEENRIKLEEELKKLKALDPDANPDLPIDS